MSCCAPGAEISMEAGRVATALPSTEELILSSCDLGQGLRQSDLAVPSVHCGTCISTIEAALLKRPEIERARVNLSARRVTVVWRQELDGVGVDPSGFVAAIAATGYAPHLFNAAGDASDILRNQLVRAVALSGFAATNIMLLSVSVWSGADASTRDMFHWISAMIAAPALVYAGRFFYVSAFNALKNGHTNMDVPIALAITLSYGVSLWETIHHGEHAWFDATVSLLFFLLIGRTLEHIMRDRARSAITGLARLSPRGAMVVIPDGRREYRPVEDIRPGDVILIAAGDRIPVDGTVVSGASDMDVSIINGESAPQTAGVGDKVRAGTLSLTGSLSVAATATADSSFLSEIIGLMEAAEGGRARYRRIADRAAHYYSPVVHLLALVSFIAWGVFGGDWKHAMLVAIAVLIITCPCALGLAVPVVQVVAAGRLFRNGVMVKDGSAMERLANVDTVLFDKTGTLTMGRPSLITPDDGASAYLPLAASLAVHSRHPLSKALYAAADGPLPEHTIVREIPGGGLEAETSQGLLRLGNRRFACGADAETALVPDTIAASEVVLSRDGRELARYLFEDELRPGAVASVQRLARDNISAAIVSGDHASAVRALAEKLGIADWKAALSPAEKASECAYHAGKGYKVLMVGDGINDAPALSAAHVSMAPSTAADIGRQAADFVFLHDSLEAVPMAISVSRQAGRLIRENFVLAIGYNIIAVPIALAGQATPMIAAIAMSTSSLIVVANALRLAGSGRSIVIRQSSENASVSQGRAVSA